MEGEEVMARLTINEHIPSCRNRVDDFIDLIESHLSTCSQQLCLSIYTQQLCLSTYTQQSCLSTYHQMYLSTRHQILSALTPVDTPPWQFVVHSTRCCCFGHCTLLIRKPFHCCLLLY